MPLGRLLGFTKDVQDLADKPSGTMTSAQLKAWFDAAPEELRVFLNNQLDIIQLEYAKQEDLNGLVIGQLPAGSITATNITVSDTNSHFTGANVETVLDELFTFANNGKTDIASVIGSPATVGDTFTQLKTHIQTSKNDLATNLTAKGQSSVGTETLDALVDKVPLISTGKKWATGNYQSASTWSTLVINTLSFRPRIIIIRSNHTGAFSKQFVYSPVEKIAFNTLGIESTSNTIKTGVSWSIADNGFTITFGETQQFNTVYTWEAFE